jgi:cardiolipin synthase
MKYNFYTNSETAWDAMREAIRGAKKSIYWEIYIFYDDAPTHRFLDLLKEKAREGVKIKIILDSLGSFQFFGNLQRDLKSHSIELLYFHRLLPWWNPHRFRRWWLLRTHRKMLIVDGAIGFVGGVNIGRKYQKWQDLHLRIEGSIVRRFIKSFSRSYRICGGRDRLYFLPKKNEKFSEKMNVLFLEHWPVGGRSFLKKFYKEKIANASKSIIFATPYFIPHAWLMRALKKAIQRGINVQVILPQKTDIWLFDLANSVFMESGYRNGIKFFLLPEMIHAKALLVDEREGVVGSNNIDALSFDWNLEAGVAFGDPQMIADLRNILDNWKKNSIVYQEPEGGRKWYHGIVVWFIKLMQPLL